MASSKRKKLGPIVGCRLTQPQHKKLKAIATKYGASFAEVLRRTLDIGLKGAFGDEAKNHQEAD